MEQIKRFIETAQTDEALKAAMEELVQRKASLDEVIALAEGHGFYFTKEDWEAVKKGTAPADELSEEQMAAVSGGKITTIEKEPFYDREMFKITWYFR